MGIPKDKRIVVGCGRGMPFRKGADLFIRVAEGVQQKLPDQTQFLWIGDFDPNEYDEELGYWRDYRQLINQNRQIEFLGFKSSPSDYLQIADLFLLTSREDPFPLVILEAAQCKVPVVCFEGAGGAAEFVKDTAGMVVPYGDTAKMVDVSTGLLTNDTLRLSLGKGGQDKVNQFNTIDIIAPQILSVCREVAKKKPVVSVIVPNFNHAKYLPERLESIFKQTFRDCEVIILDDASTDNSLEIIHGYTNRGEVKLIQNASNSGSPFRQWVTGLEMARSELIWIAESDDLCESNFLQDLLPAFTDSNVKLAYTDSWIINSIGKVTGDYLSSDYLRDLSMTKWNKSYKVTAEAEINDGLGIKNTILNISSAVFRKSELDESFYESLKLMHFAGDWLFIVKLLQNGFVHYEAQKLNYHRRHEESVIGELIKKKEVEGFYKEIAEVQRLVCSLYNFDADYLNKWTKYHHKQWNEFFPNASFDEFKVIFPYDELMDLIKNKSGNKGQ